MPTSLILGHSLCARLFIAEGSDSRFSLSLKLDKFTEVRWHGVGGLKTLHLLQSESHELKQIVESCLPDIVFLQIGGNDIKIDSDPCATATDIQNVTEALVKLKVRRVIVGAVMPRFEPTAEASAGMCRWRGRKPPRFRSASEIHTYVEKYNDCARIVNEILSSRFKGRSDVIFWRHNSQFTFRNDAERERIRSRFGDDGVHHSMQGMYQFAKSIRGALIATLSLV